MKTLAVLLLILIASAACAQPTAFLAIRVVVPSGLPAQMLPVLASADLAEARQAWGQAPSPGLVTASETVGGRERAVLAQLDVPEGKRVQVALWLPSEPAGERIIRVRLQGAPSVPGPAPLTVTRDGAAVTITNATYVITHDAAKNGGMPSKIVFPQTGKTLDSFMFNDRLHSKAISGFRLGDDKSPAITVTAAGPLYAEVQVRARYVRAGQAPPGDPHAVYTYGYFAGLPVVRVSADIQQSGSFSWNELHCFEFYFKDNSLSHFATDAEALTPFKDDSAGHRSGGWGALVDGKNAVGLLGSAMIYDGQSNYGRYLHGPWVQWSMPTAQFALDLWIGSADDPVAAVSKAADSKLRVLAGTVYTPKLLGQVATLRTRSQTQPRLGWMLALLEGALQQRTLSLTEAEQAAATILTAKPDGSNALRLGKQVLYLVAGRRLGMAVSQAQDQIVSLYDLRSRRELLAAPALWFRLKLGNAEGATRTLDSTDFFLRQPAPVAALNRPTELQFLSKGTELPGLTVTLKPTLLDDRLQWSLEVDNARADWSLLSVTSPLLRVKTLGDDPADDHVLVPDGFGRSYPVLTRSAYGGTYPSAGATMQWLAVTDVTSGLYLGYHDPTAATKMLRSGESSGGSVPLEFEMPAPDATVMGNDYHPAGEIVIAAVDGGYFPACRLYRRWLDQKAPWWPEPGKPSRSDTPRWVQDVQTWVLWGAGDAAKTVAPTKAFAQAMGVPTAIHWYNWHVIPFDDDYPNYFPTKPGFREGVKELRQAGIRVMPYINGRLWDTDTQNFIDEAHQYATKREDGEPYTEEYGSKQKLAPMCVHTAYWQDKVQEIVLKLVGEEGVDGVYIDQVAAAGPVLCYDKSHGHPLAGGHWWVDGYWKMLGSLQQKIAQVSPDKMLTTESNAESYAKYFDAYLMCNSNSDYEVPLFPAVYGGKILMFGTYMSNGDWQDLTLMALRQGKLFAFGTQLWWSDPNVVKNETAAKWLRDLAHLRQRVNEFFVHGQMAAPPVFASDGTSAEIGMLKTEFSMWGPNKSYIHTPDLWATTWRLENGRLLMPLVNLPKQDRTFTLQFDPAAYGLKANGRVKIERVTAAGVAETVTKQGKFALPVKLGPAEATALVITPQ